MKLKQISTLTIAGFITIIFMISIVSANQKVCINKGEHYPCPNPAKVCKTDYCYFCVNNNGCVVYDKNCPGNPICGSTNGSIDITPPVLTINSPVNDQIYNGRAVLFSLTTNELATIYYKDNSNERDNWKRIASKVTSYSKSISLKDGLNELTIRAVDSKGNEAFIIKKFRVDSQKPKITKIAQTKGFATGKFDVWFTETNPQTLILNYGNQINGRKNANVELSQCSGDAIKGKYYCTINVSLSEYNGQNIDYSFRLNDIANSFADSKLGNLNVDTSNPVFNNIGSMIKVSGKYVYFNLSINEPNLLFVLYYDNNDNKAKWQKLCTSLKNGICYKKVTFSPGNHIVDIKVDDKAGNSAATSVEFNIA